MIHPMNLTCLHLKTVICEQKRQPSRKWSNLRDPGDSTREGVFTKSSQNNIAKGKRHWTSQKCCKSCFISRIREKVATETLVFIDFEQQSTIFTAWERSSWYEFDTFYPNLAIIWPFPGSISFVSCNTRYSCCMSCHSRTYRSSRDAWLSHLRKQLNQDCPRLTQESEDKESFVGSIWKAFAWPARFEIEGEPHCYTTAL